MLGEYWYDDAIDSFCDILSLNIIDNNMYPLDEENGNSIEISYKKQYYLRFIIPFVNALVIEYKNYYSKDKKIKSSPKTTSSFVIIP